ncbi:NAD(P)-binding protein [Trichodelitschia bisporula]|uniref:NAD(P)-binding protein n=1 Tax=Trichodelitschia bisporula TaxID=703511 RepID=A0A6G1HQF2_9PEZI|nr:NAD(P)-binding protein [Trichodelitschia bisporula]
MGLFQVSLRDPTGSFAGKTIIVTGSNTGLGLEAAIKFTQLNASRLILAVRDPSKGEAAKATIQQRVPNHTTNIEVWPLDMASYASIKSFVHRVESDVDRLDIALLNAGFMSGKFQLSEYGWETVLQVNTVSTTLLALLLLPKLRASRTETSTPVLEVVSSGLHTRAKVNAEHRALEHVMASYNNAESVAEGPVGEGQYSRSKLFVLQAFEVIARSVLNKSTGKPDVLVVVSCPGACKSELGREMTGLLGVAKNLFYRFIRTAEEGSRTLVSATLLGEEAHGRFWTHDKIAEKTSILRGDDGEKLRQKVWREIFESLRKDNPDNSSNHVKARFIPDVDHQAAPNASAARRGNSSSASRKAQHESSPRLAQNGSLSIPHPSSPAAHYLKMRLIDCNTFKIEEFFGDAIPQYAILSHTWETDEVELKDMSDLKVARKKSGFNKIERCAWQATEDRLQYCWVDTCCIDKSSSAELTEAINSMFRWYRVAAKCYAYLWDVTSGPDERELQEWEFRQSKWFTRGWTLQELLAPQEVEFYTRDWRPLGSRSTFSSLISNITRIQHTALLAGDLSDFSAAQKMSWMSARRTTRVEDTAYCMLGLFGINMPLLYGEGVRAFIRLQEEIIKISDDHSLFAWRDTVPSPSRYRGLLARSPLEFQDAHDVVPLERESGEPYTITNRGLSIALPLHDRPARTHTHPGHDPAELEYVIMLACGQLGRPHDALGIYLRRLSASSDQFVRIDPHELYVGAPMLEVVPKALFVRHASSLPRGHTTERVGGFYLRGIAAEPFAPVFVTESPGWSPAQEDVGWVRCEAPPGGPLATSISFRSKEAGFRAVEPRVRLEYNPTPKAMLTISSNGITFVIRHLGTPSSA